MKAPIAAQAQTADFDRIVEYYDRSWFDYSFVWLNRRNLAVHFGFYDEQNRTHAKALENLNRVLADLVDVKPGERVLDAGCGIGGSAIWLAENRDSQVIGITPVQSQLTRGNRSVARRGVADKVQLLNGDYASTKFDDESFDVVWAMESLCHAPCKASVYNEFNRILKPGGRLVIAEYMRTDRPLSGANEKLVHDWLESWAIPDIDTAAEHQQSLTDAGFADIVNRDVTQNVERSLRLLYKLTYFGKPIDKILKKIGFRRRSLNVDGAYKIYEALQEKAWYYSILTAHKA